MPERIQDVVEKAGRLAEQDILKYLEALESTHWSTLRATVRRGGAFLGARHIDIPNDFAVRIDEPVGLFWSTLVLAEVRKRTEEIGADYIEIVNRVAEWAAEGDVPTQRLSVFQQQLRDDMRALDTIGKEEVDELRSAVRQQLLQRIKDPIRKKCKSFMESGRGQGTGVKKRILDLIGGFVPEVVDIAAQTANAVLRNEFQSLEHNIRTVFDAYQDPLCGAHEAIVGSGQEKPRADVLTRIDEIMRDAPVADSDQPS